MFLFLAVNIAILRVSVDLLCIPMKVLELFPLESLFAFLEYMFALQQQESLRKCVNNDFNIYSCIDIPTNTMDSQC